MFLSQAINSWKVWTKSPDLLYSIASEYACPLSFNDIFTKFFKIKKKLNHKEILFQNIKRNSGVTKIFDSISNYNEWSEVRYVGGCIRKILNNEDYDDIDLATNLNPDQIKECLVSNNI